MKSVLLFALMIMLPLISSAQQDKTSMTGKEKIVAIPSSEKSMDALIDQSFSRCPFFCLYNTKTGNITFAENKHASASGGASHLAIGFLAENGVSEIYAVQVGRNAKMDLDRYKIHIMIVVCRG